MRSEVKGYIFIAFSIAVIATLFLPVIRTDMIMNSETTTTYMKMIPAVSAVLTLIVAAGCVFMVFAGLKQYCGWASAALVIIGGINGYLFYVKSRSTTGLAGENVNELLNLFTNTKMEINYSLAWGFYLYIIAIILTVIFGFAYTVSRD